MIEPTAAVEPVAAASMPPAACRNCGTALLGDHCYACGQPLKGLVRPLGNLFGDLLDSVFNVDARILRTLPPLLAKPGFLTTEYFAGRQIRYVTPVRLFFFLCILAFFVARFAITDNGAVNIDINDPDSGEIGAAMTEADVIARRDAALKRLEAKRAKLPQGPGRAGSEAGIDVQADLARSTADTRLEQLRDAAGKGQPAPPPMEDTFTFGNDKPWDAKNNPVHLPGVLHYADGWFNDKVGRAKANFKRIKAEPDRYTEAFVGAIPTALFVLVPVFALLLKLGYLFKRRLYMEHLVVALHSHAFLSLVLLLVFACLALQEWAGAGALKTALGWPVGLLVAWVPIYLLLMQKRVYGQGWPMTLLKYSVLGTVYMVLLSFAIAAAAAASLVWM